MSLRGVIVIATLALAGTQVGSAIGWLLAGQLPFDTAVLPLPTVGYAGRTPAPEQLAGYLFAPTPGEDPGPTPPTEGGRARCSLPWRMVGSFIDRRESPRSFAAVVTPEGGRLLTTDMTHAGLTVVALEASTLTLASDDGTLCQIGMFDSAITMLPEDPPAPATAGVTRMSSGHVRIDRALIAGAGSLHPRIRVLPFERDGQMIGARLYGIRADDPIYAAGARNGDVLRQVDGEALIDPDVALAAYGRLMAGAPVRVTLERRGETIETTIEVAN